MSVQIKLGDDLIWGTEEAGTLTQGKILSCESKSGGKMFEQEDENGETYSVIFYDDTEEITVEVLAGEEATKPARGDEIDIAGVTDALVTESADKWSAGATKKMSITFKKWTA